MACGCGKKGNLPQRNMNGAKPAIRQNIVRSAGNNQPQTQIEQTAPVGMDRNRLEIEKKRRESIRKSLGKMIWISIYTKSSFLENKHAKLWKMEKAQWKLYDV